MSSIQRIPLFVLLAALVFPGGAFAQSGGLAFLKIEPTAEALGAGSALTATSSDAFSTFLNPAGLGGDKMSSAGLTYNAWTGSSQIFNFVARFKTGKLGGLGVQLSSSTSGGIDTRSEPGPASSTTSVTYLAAGVGYGQQFGPARLGVTAKYVLEHLFDYHANGIAFDLGAQADVIPDRVWIGAAVQNLGHMEALNVEQTDLPTTYRIGAAIQPVTVQMSDDGSEPVRLYVSTDVLYRSDEDATSVQVGIWVNALDFLWIRGGLLSNNELRKVTIGLGLEYESFKFDYAYLPFTEGYGSSGQVVTLQYSY